MDKYLLDPDVLAFLSANNISDVVAKRYISDIVMFVKDKQHLELVLVDDFISLKQKVIASNPGLFFLDKPFFKNKIDLKDVDLNNPTKNSTIVKLISTTDHGFYLCGNNGIGKSFLSVAIANEHYKRSKQKTLFVFWPDFIEKSKRFSDDNVHYINKVKYCKRLIIDDLGQESISGWSRDDILNAIIAYRCEKKLYTIITSNYYQKELLQLYTLKAIDQKKAKSIVSKLGLLAPEVNLQGKDYRV